MRVMEFSYRIFHVPGKNLVIADTLSRSPATQISIVDQEFTKEVDAYVNIIIDSIPATDRMLRVLSPHNLLILPVREYLSTFRLGGLTNTKCQWMLNTIVQYPQNYLYRRGY